MLKNLYGKLPLLLVFLVAVALSVKSLREPDLWWQIRTGEWILEHHAIPKQDVFSFTYNGAPWINIKWGFEVLAALLTHIAAPESIFILQALVSCLVVLFLIKAYKANGGSINNYALTAIAMAAVVLGLEYRFNGRPEMFSHLFTAVFLYVLLQYRNQGGRIIFWLLPLQIIWANFHEAFGIGIVLIAIFTAGAWVEYFLALKVKGWPAVNMPTWLTALLAAGIAALVINPNGTALLTRPFNILGQVYENKYTTELLDFRSPEYWQWNSYLTIGITLLAIGGTFIYFKQVKTKHNRLYLAAQHFGIGYLLTLLAFLYLGLTAYRNLAFFILAVTPLFLFGWQALLATARVVLRQQKVLHAGACVMLLAIYGLVVSNQYYKLTNSRDKFGLQVLPAFNPVGAGGYVQAHQLQGTCFSDYLTSSYLLWKLQPGFKTFIDLRDLDVFPPDFFNTFAEAVTYPDAFEKLDSAYHFNYAVIYRPQFGTLHKYLYNQSNFKPVFADAVAVVYQRRGNTDTASATLNFTPVPVAGSKLAFINYILNPAFAQTNADKIDNDYLAASYFLVVGQFDAAEKYAQKAATNGTDNYKGSEILGEVYFNRALVAGNTANKAQLLGYAATAYQQSLGEKEDFAPALLGLGAVYFQQQNYNLALEHFEKAIAADKTSLNACIYAAECCKYFISKNTDADFYTGKAIEFYKKADVLNPTNPAIMFNLGLLYSRQNNCSEVQKNLGPVIDYPGLSPEEKRTARQCLNKCSR